MHIFASRLRSEFVIMKFMCVRSRPRECCWLPNAATSYDRTFLRVHLRYLFQYYINKQTNVHFISCFHELSLTIISYFVNLFIIILWVFMSRNDVVPDFRDETLTITKRLENTHYHLFFYCSVHIICVSVCACLDIIIYVLRRTWRTGFRSMPRCLVDSWVSFIISSTPLQSRFTRRMFSASISLALARFINYIN